MERKKYVIVEDKEDGSIKEVYRTNSESFAKSQLQKFRMFYKNKKFSIEEVWA